MVCLQTIQQDLSDHDELWPILVELREEEGKDKKKGEKNQQIFTKWVIGLSKTKTI